MTANTKQRRAFLAALTSTDQLPANERQRLAEKARRSAKSQAKGNRYVAWMEAQAAYHDAVAAQTRAMVARVAAMPERLSREARHAIASHDMLAAYSRLMLLPLVGLDDAKARRVMIRKGRGAIDNGEWRPAYNAAEAGWLAHIDAETARIGGN